MTKDTPSPTGGGGRRSPKKPPAALLEEQRRELEAVRAELEAERVRSQAERRRFASQTRELREAGERERQQLAEQLRSRWEMQRARELRQLRDAVLRERDAEIRQLLRCKEAELRQLQQRLHEERDRAVRQARELQRQLAEELLGRGHCGRPGSTAAGGLAGAVECRCRLQDVLAKLRWETDGEQAARIRHLQAALDVERGLFLKYVLENFHWDPASVLSTRPPRPNLGRPEPGAATAATVVAAVRFQAAGAGELPTAGVGELPSAGVGELPAPAAATATTTAAATPASAPTFTPPGPAPRVAPATGPVYRPRPATCATRPRSLDSLRAPPPRPYSFPLDDAAARSSRSLDGSPSPAESPGAGEPEAGGPLDGSPLYPAILPRPQLARDDLGTGEKAPGKAPRPSPEEPQLGCGRPPRAWGSLPRKEVPSLQQPGKEGEAGEAPLALAPGQPASAAPRHGASPELEYNDLVKQNSELAGALETLARHCSGLREENSQLRRGFPESIEKVQRLKVKNAELAVIAKRLEERARKLQETSLRAVRAPVPEESGAALELCRRAFQRQRAQDLTEQTSALLAKDKQIEDLRQECRQLQAQVAACQGPAQWLDINDFDQLLRESQKEVLHLQRQVTLQNFKSPYAQRAASPPPSARLQNPAPEEAAEAQELKLQVEALEQALSERRKCCESLELDVGKAQQRFQRAEGRLQQVLSENSWLTRENSKLQEKAQWIEKVDLENSEMRGKLELVSEERDSAALLTAQLQQQASQREARCQQLERDLQDARSALAAQQGEAQRMRQAHEQMQREHREVLQTLEAQLRELERPCAQQAQEVKPPPQLWGKWAKKATCPLEGVPDSSTLAKKASTQAGASDTASGSPSHQSCPAPEMDRGSEVEELEADSLSRALEPEGPRSHHGYPSQGSQDSQDSQDSHGPSKLKIFLARYDYDPFAGPNDQPEAELPLTAGEYVYVFGDMDEDGFYAGELMDGQRGLVPSNLVEQISDSEILNLQPPEASDSCLESSQEVKSHSENSSPERKVTGSLEVVSYGNLLPKKLEKDIMEEASDSSGVPCPSKLTLIQQLPRGVVVDWEAPFAPDTHGAVQGYNVYVDNELWQNVCAGSRTRAAINDLDLQTRAYRISVQSVMEKGCSNRLQCSFLVGRGFCPAPSQLRLRNLTSTSAEITWLYSNSSYPHMVYLNEQEHGLTKAGVYCYTFQNLQPSTRYCAHVEVRPARETSKKLWEEMASSITFSTPSAGPPDPPLDVLVEYHTSPGTLLVSWIPVTIDSAGSSNGVPVTGYAVYSGGQKVIEVPSPTAGTVLVEFSQIQQQKLSQEVSVRTMSHYGESPDSVPAQIPGEWLKRSSSYRSPQAFPVNHSCGELAHPQTRSTLRPFVPISQEKSILGSFDTKTSTPLPASCGSAKMVASDGFPEDSFQRGLAKPSEGDLPSPGDIKAPQGPGEAYALSPLPSSRKESHGPKTIRDSRFGNPRHLSDGQIGLEEKNARKAVPRWIQVQELLDTPPENGPMKEISRENNSGGKVPRNRVETEALKGMTQSSEAPADYSHLADLASLEEEDQYVNMWGTRRPGQKKEFRLQKGQTGLAGPKKVTPLPEPSALLYPAPSGKMTKILKTSPTMAAPRPWLRAPGSSPLKGKGANDPVRVFVALWDYDPQLMSTIPETAEEGLAFQRGQLLTVWGDRDPDGFYYGECEGRMGYIPGDMVSEVQVEGGGILKKLLWQDRLPSGVSLDGLLGLSTQPPSPRKSFSMGRRAQLWHPQTMVAAFDYHPRQSASLSVTKELTLSTGDVVTVLGSVDDNGFFYGELNGQRGLVPSNLLKAPALNAE
ncbi:RIMS-binding protein 3A-like [Vombatus ursinus]|uniref:RIMS-binding protein 3A-like n=1 Tax=Vombatus ursinus TaxID=29139 RepID=UPI000FFD119D|nr:RIMS-binding protein 3A-like [Vombatus ursinus]